MMNEYKLYEAEYNLMEIIWTQEPINSTKLVRESQELLGWKKSTTYTVLRKLIQKELVRNEDAMVSAVVPREQVLYAESRDFLDRFFQGSLPSFLASFTEGKKLSEKELSEIRKMIGEDHP